MLNVAVVGLGWWGRTIVGLLGQSRKLRAALLVDPYETAAGAFASRAGIPLAASLPEALASPEIQAVVLCTPHSQHCEQIVASARAKKHVFCEKPLCMSRAEVLRAIDAVERAGVTLAVGHERRFETPMLELGRMADSGELGTLLQIEANFSQDKFLALPPDNWRLSGKEAPAGPMTATGVHLLDLAVRFLGPARRVFASARQLGSRLANGDTLGALVQFESGANALISAILATPFVGRFALYGSRGWAEIVDKNHPEAPQGWIVRTCKRGGEVKSKDYPPMPAVLANLEAFADAALGRAPYPVPREQMRATVCALEAIFRSAASGGIEPVEN
jgi:predicted dehydrogenase